MNETITTKQLAAILGISVQRVNELGRKGKIQREADGGWDLVKVNGSLRRNMNRHQSSKALGGCGEKSPMEHGPSDKDIGESFSEAQRQREWIRVQKEEMELRRRRGELLERSEVEQIWSEGQTRFVSRLLQLPDDLADAVAVMTSVIDIRALIEREVNSAIRSMRERESNAA